ncbi:MAG: hypothetical protein KF851_02780 [Pirellulaceae bacterium]|nr:hypothetical protein [Pirellulaceae bacterium]
MPQISNNPFAPTITREIVVDPATEKLRAVSRIFFWIGLLGAVVYVPMVVGCIISLIASLIGRPFGNPEIATPLVLVLATAFNGVVLSIWITYIITSFHIKHRRLHARTRALFLSVVLALGFPILTIPGVVCFRWIRRYLKDNTPVK